MQKSMPQAYITQILHVYISCNLSHLTLSGSCLAFLDIGLCNTTDLYLSSSPTVRPKAASVPVPEMAKTKDKDEKGSSGKGTVCWVWACLCL